MKKYYFLFTLFAFIFVTSLLIIILPSSKPKSVVVSPTPTSTPTEVHWKTYRNEKYGFEFQYQPNKFFNESDSGKLWLEGLPFSLVVEKLTSKFNLAPNIGSTKIAGVVWSIYHSNNGADDRGNGQRNYYVTNHGQYQYMFYGFDIESKASVEKILSTFKFLPQATPTLSSKTETNLGYIKKVYTKDGKNYIDIDYVQWIDDASMPNHFRISNTNPLIRTFEVALDAPIAIIDYVNGDMATKKINLTEISNRLYNLYNVKIEGGKITAISERYVP